MSIRNPSRVLGIRTGGNARRRIIKTTPITITNSSDDTAPVTTYKNGIYRLYEESYDLKADHWFVLTDGPNASGNHYYWNNASNTSYPEATISSETGHRIWFDNSNSKWSNVYPSGSASRATIPVGVCSDTT